MWVKRKSSTLFRSTVPSTSCQMTTFFRTEKQTSVVVKLTVFFSVGFVFSKNNGLSSKRVQRTGLPYRTSMFMIDTDFQRNSTDQFADTATIRLDWSWRRESNGRDDSSYVRPNRIEPVFEINPEDGGSPWETNAMSLETLNVPPCRSDPECPLKCASNAKPFDRVYERPMLTGKEFHRPVPQDAHSTGAWLLKSPRD